MDEAAAQRGATAEVVVAQADAFESQVAHGVVPSLLDAPASPGIDLAIAFEQVLASAVELKDGGVLDPGTVDPTQGEAVEVIHPDLRFRQRYAPPEEGDKRVRLQPRLSASVHDPE